MAEKTSYFVKSLTHLIFISSFLFDVTHSIAANKIIPRLRFLEGNSWSLMLNNVEIAIDPVFSTLDFGIPLLYTGDKKAVDGEKELARISKEASCVLISQGFDDHCQEKTIRKILSMRPEMPYIAPPSAAVILKSCGVPDACITTILPGEVRVVRDASSGKDVAEVFATSGALLGPPWQQKENGYIIRPVSKPVEKLPTGQKAPSGFISSVLSPWNNKGQNTARTDFPSIYYEPHCDYDESELIEYRRLNGPVDCVITPVVSQELPAFTLVGGGGKALDLARLLGAKFLVPMANGELEQSGLLSKIIQSRGSAAEFKQLASSEIRLRVFDVEPGEVISVS